MMLVNATHQFTFEMYYCILSSAGCDLSVKIENMSFPELRFSRSAGSMVDGKEMKEKPQIHAQTGRYGCTVALIDVPNLNSCVHRLLPSAGNNLTTYQSPFSQTWSGQVCFPSHEQAKVILKPQDPDMAHSNCTVDASFS